MSENTYCSDLERVPVVEMKTILYYSWIICILVELQSPQISYVFFTPMQ